MTTAVVGSLVVGQAPAGPGQNRDAPSGSSSAAPVAMAAFSRVVLERRRGYVEGDGQTVYVANGTAFRPGPVTVALPPRVRARSWVVVDLDSGRLLGRHRPHAELPQASTMKLLTALTATRTIRAGTRHRVTRYEASQTCSCAGLKRGRVYDRDTLMKGMLLPSGNDAAEAVAGSHPDGRRAFYRAMNRVASRLGAWDTRARNASGLTAEGSHSSAHDLVVLLRAAVANETVAGFLSLRSAEVATVTGLLRHTVWRNTDYVNEYPQSLGKGGWTTPAQSTLVVVTDIEGHRVAVASLGAPSEYSTSDVRALTTWAAASFDGLRSVGRLPYS